MTTKYKQLTPSDRKACYYMLLSFCEDGVPKRGAWANVAGVFSVDPKTVARLWKDIRGRMEIDNIEVDDDHDAQQHLIDKSKGLPEDMFKSGASTRRKGKFIHDREELKATIKSIPFNKRRKLRHLATQLDIPLSTVHKMMKEFKILKRTSNSLKPTLTDGNKHIRMLHCLEHIDPTSINTRHRLMQCVEMNNEVHVDKKWFFVCRDGETYIIVSDEEEPPARYVSHKSHIAKVMFLCAQARPRRLPNRTWWDGKIGIWPVGYHRPAQKMSKNRPAGTRLFESESIDMDKYRHMLQNFVVPAMLTEFPDCEYQRFPQIIIQQDGAPTHVNPRDYEWMEFLTDMGLEEKIKLVTQPANSPDLNVNDLGFFAALQAMCYCTTPSNAVELIEMVEQTYNDYPMNKINRMWVTLQTVFNGMLDTHGGNTYPLTHMGKEKLEKAGRLPRVLDAHPVARCYL